VHIAASIDWLAPRRDRDPDGAKPRLVEQVKHGAADARQVDHEGRVAAQRRGVEQPSDVPDRIVVARVERQPFEVRDLERAAPPHLLLRRVRPKGDVGPVDPFHDADRRRVDALTEVYADKE
jgi:hypothetical protein